MEMPLELRKTRSRLGAWLDDRGMKQEWLIRRSGVNKQTISRTCNQDYIPSGRTIQRIVQALREVDPLVKATDFWNL